MRHTPTRRGRTAGVLLLTGLLSFTPAVASAAGGTDRTPPTVTSTTPSNGTVGAAVTVKPTATFSEPIQPASVAATLTAGGTAVPFTTAYASTTNTVTITPRTDLTWSTKYILTVKAKDVAGNQMTGAAPTWSFTTTSAPDNPPVARLVASPTSGTSPLSVHLDASGSTDTDSTPVAGYNFDWGDGTGTSGEDANPTADHVYTQVGTWTAVVTVRDTAGKTSTASVPITVKAAPPPDNAPVASLVASPSTGEAPLGVTLDASATTDTDGTPVDTYAFDFGDGSSRGPDAGPIAAHTYTATGTYTASVTATDTAGNSSQASTTVVVTKAAVPDNAPAAALQVALSPAGGPYAVTADAAQSTDDDDTPIATYTFDYGDGSDPLTGTAATGQHTYAGAGTYTVTVTVTDTGGKSSQATATVTVVDPPPPPVDDPPVASLTLSPGSGTAPVNVTADASRSTDTVGIESYAFDWGDGTTVAAQGASTVQHTFTTAGSYTVTVTVTDTGGKSATASATVSVAAAPPPPPVSAKPTSVVLTFDDGTLGQDDAAKVMADRGLHGTFYINSARVGMDGYLSAAQLKAIAAAGNEIGGHTLDHADLPTLTSDDAARQVCNDRVALHDMGFKVTSLAYPFGAYNSSVQATVKKCGYNNARIVASLKSDPYGCASCVTANAVPPADPYAIKTNTSVRADTTLAILQKYVTQAENDKGGLVPIVFHHVGSTGDVNEMSLDVLTQFVDWLSQRPSTTQVVTMDQVIGGAVQPYVAGPALASALNVLNPSLEAGSGVTPTCFNPTGYGANSPTWSRDSSSAHTGSFGEGLRIASWTTGDRKLVIKQDVTGNACAPAGTPGRQYQPTVWYKGSWTGSTHVNIVTYYRDVNGAWQVWATGANLAPSPTMQQASLTTSSLPAGATAVSFGLALVGNGQLSTDDYGMADVS